MKFRSRDLKAIGAAFLMLVCSISFSAESNLVPGSTLEDFFTAAINYSPELRIAEEDLNISGARKQAANAQLLPQLSAGASISDNRLNQLNRFQEFDGERYYLSLSQTLFNWQQFAARKQAYLVEDQLEEQYYYQLASILTDVAERYFNVLQSEDALESINSEIDALTNQLDQIQNFYERQLAQITDLYRGQASLAAVQAERLQLQAEIALNKEALRSISGLNVGPLYRLGDEAEIPPLEFSQQYYLQQAQGRNHQILASEYALQAAEEGISERRGAYMPQVSFIAQRQDSDVGFDNLPINRTDNTYIGINLSIPIYAGGQNKARVSEAISRKSIAEYELRSAQLRTRESVRAAHLQVQASEVQTDAAIVLVESTTLAAEAMQQGFALGTVTSVDVLNALRDQYQAERDFQTTRYNHIRYLLTLKRETGTLSAEDMLEVGSWLEPEALQ
ncbi:MAG: TolC family protein [Gammaproteobacteria bacterium]|nr:TolC family protein [Gammaproteobacteria bacterium]